MKSYFFKKLKRYSKIFLLMGLIVISCISLFLSLSLSYNSLDKRFDYYFEEYNHPDIVVSSEIVEENLVNDINLNYFKIDSLDKSLNIKVSLTCNDSLYASKLITFNKNCNEKFYYYEKNNNEGLYVEKGFASANNIKLNDVIKIKYESIEKEFNVVAIVSNPETLVYESDYYTFGANPDQGTIFIDEDLFFLESTRYYNTFNIYTNSNQEEVLEKLKSKFNSINLDGYTFNNSPSKKEAISNLIPLKELCIIVPLIFLLSMLLIYSLLISKIVKDLKKEISILLSYGFSHFKIILFFVLLVLFVTFISILFGIIIGILLANYIYKLHVDALYMPLFSFVYNFKSFIIPILLTLLVSIVSILLNLKNILKYSPIEIANVSFNTKEVKSNNNIQKSYFNNVLLRNKKRFISKLLCMIISGLLIFISLSFNASKNSLTQNVYSNRINYDYQIVFENTSSNTFNNSLITNNINYEISYFTNQDLYFNENTLNINIRAINTNSNLVNIVDKKNNNIKVNNGIVIDNKTASLLNLKENDVISINNQSLIVEAIAFEPVYRLCYISIDTYNSLHLEGNEAILIKNSDSLLLKSLLVNEENVLSYSNTSRVKKEIERLFSSYSIGVYIIIITSFLLALFVIINLLISSLMEREKEFSILEILGCNKKKIKIAFLKEQLLVWIISLPFSLIGGIYLAKYILNNMETSDRIYPFINEPMTYFITSLSTLFIVLIGFLIISKNISKWNLVKNVKEKE